MNREAEPQRPTGVGWSDLLGIILMVITALAAAISVMGAWHSFQAWKRLGRVNAELDSLNYRLSSPARLPSTQTNQTGLPR